MIQTRGICLAVALLAACAGTAGANSVFNLSLFGQRMETGDVRAVSLGGAVQVVADSLAVTQLNPAMLAYAKRVTFGANVFSGVDINKSEAGSDREGSLRFSSLSFAFSAFSPRLTLGAGYRGRFDPSGGFTTVKTTDTGSEYREVFERTGGLLSFPFTAAVDVSPRLKAGAFFSLETGRITNRWVTNFDEVATIDAFSQQERTMSGTGWGIGVEASPFRGMAVGLAYEGEISYDTDVVETFTNTNSDTSISEDGLLPDRWTASLRWRLSPRVTMYLGGAYSDMTKVRGMAFPGSRLNEEIRASLGFEVADVMGSLPLRFSTAWDEFPYTLPEGTTVTRIAGTVGTGFNLRGGRGKLDLAVQFVQTGSVGANGLQNRAVRLYVGIGGAETWTHKRERK